jgi:hypothetical protein
LYFWGLLLFHLNLWKSISYWKFHVFSWFFWQNIWTTMGPSWPIIIFWMKPKEMNTRWVIWTLLIYSKFVPRTNICPSVQVYVISYSRWCHQHITFLK